MTAFRRIILLCLGLAAALLSSCAPGKPAAKSRIESIGAPAGLASQSNGVTATLQTGGRLGIPRVALDGGEELLGIFDLNLDMDQGDEQVAAFRRQEDPSEAIQLAILDQNPLRESWERVWTGSTLCSSWPTFSLALKDLLGSFGTDLVCSGMNAAGRQTLTAFHRDADTPPAGFRQILAIEGDSIEIREEGRGEAYESGQSPGMPYGILSFDRDMASHDYLDQTQSLWAWNGARSSYERASSSPVSRGRIERRVVEQYLEKGTEALEPFLDGTWYMAGSPDAGSRMVQFDLRGRAISFSEPGKTRSLTSYDWISSQPTSLGLFIVATNAAVDRLRLHIEIELTGADSFSMRTRENMEQLKVESDTSWNGAYRRLTMDDNLSTPLPSPRALPALEGRWSRMGSVEAEFTGKTYLWKENQRTERGVFSLYHIEGGTILVLKALSESGLILRTRTYLVQSLAATAEKPASIALRSAILTVEGLDLRDDTPISLERLP